MKSSGRRPRYWLGEISGAHVDVGIVRIQRVGHQSLAGNEDEAIKKESNGSLDYGYMVIASCKQLTPPSAHPLCFLFLLLMIHNCRNGMHALTYEIANLKGKGGEDS